MADVTDVTRYVPSDAMQEIESGIDHLPASVVNFQVKAVDSDIKAKERLLALAEQQANEFKDRITVMHEHLLNVQQELVHTQQLLDSKQREIETEVHLKQLSEREAGKIAQEVVQTEKEMLEVQDALNIVQNNIFRGNERLDQFKMQLNWNQEELEQWTLAAKQKEEDNKALQKCASVATLQSLANLSSRHASRHAIDPSPPRAHAHRHADARAGRRTRRRTHRHARAHARVRWKVRACGRAEDQGARAGGREDQHGGPLPLPTIPLPFLCSSAPLPLAWRIPRID
jgi:hypothetical protein